MKTLRDATGRLWETAGGHWLIRVTDQGGQRPIIAFGLAAALHQVVDGDPVGVRPHRLVHDVDPECCRLISVDVVGEQRLVLEREDGRFTFVNPEHMDVVEDATSSWAGEDGEYTVEQMGSPTAPIRFQVNGEVCGYLMPTGTRVKASPS